MSRARLSALRDRGASRGLTTHGGCPTRPAVDGLGTPRSNHCTNVPKKSAKKYTFNYTSLIRIYDYVLLMHISEHITKIEDVFYHNLSLYIKVGPLVYLL